MSDSFAHGYGLLVGVGESVYPAWSLPVTVKDVQALRAVFVDPGLCGYPDGNIRMLHDGTATRESILDGLAWLQTMTVSDREATAVFYFSGHGWLHEPTDKYYLIPRDVVPFDIPGSALSSQTLIDALRKIEARRLLVVIDSCHAEGMATAKEASFLALPTGLTQVSMPKSTVGELKQGEGRAVFTSSRGRQLSWILPDGSMSIYTRHLIEGLQGAGNLPGDDFVRISNLMNYLGKAVPSSAREYCQSEQTPFFDTATEDFPVAILRGGKGLPPGGWPAIESEVAESMRQIATIAGSGVIAQGQGAVAVGGDVHGGIHTGRGDIVGPG